MDAALQAGIFRVHFIASVQRSSQGQGDAAAALQHVYTLAPCDEQHNAPFKAMYKNFIQSNVAGNVAADLCLCYVAARSRLRMPVHTVSKHARPE
jgi:hypothetical protein